ncbi:MAG: hypothetical protein GY701_16650 [Sulfitobacter sp.]|nr:hypothetical protein [Sulfitobacter sp.]
MGELTLPQPLATLAVEGVVNVLVVPEPPECEYCDGDGRYFIYESVGDHSILVCSDCDGGLARWPAEVTIRSSEDEPEGPLAQPYRTDEPEPPAFWEAFGCNADQVAGVELVDSPDGEWWQMIFPWGGEVVGAVTVEAAVPIVPMFNAANLHPYPFIGFSEHKEYDALVLWPTEGEQVDLADQLAFQDFPVGHTALILGGETDD